MNGMVPSIATPMLATISNVTIRINNNGLTTAHMLFSNQQICFEYDFVLTSLIHLYKLNALMIYTNTPDNINLLNGKTVRIVLDPFSNYLRYIGSPTENRFFSANSPDFSEVSLTWKYKKVLHNLCRTFLFFYLLHEPQYGHPAHLLLLLSFNNIVIILTIINIIITTSTILSIPFSILLPTWYTSVAKSHANIVW